MMLNSGVGLVVLGTLWFILHSVFLLDSFFFFLFKLINLFLLYPYGCMSARGKVISLLGLALPGDVLLIGSLKSCFSVQVDSYSESVLTVPNFPGFL